MFGSVEAVPPAAARNRSVGAARAGVTGPRKEFRPRIADNSLISKGYQSKMEGIRSNFWPFLNSRTRLGRAHDASLKSRGARPEANAAFRRVGGFGETGARRPVARKWCRKGLKGLISRPGIVWPSWALLFWLTGFTGRHPFAARRLLTASLRRPTSVDRKLSLRAPQGARIVLLPVISLAARLARRGRREYNAALAAVRIMSECSAVW